MQTLLEGYRRFHATGWRDHAASLATLAREGQKPRALVIACADSRIDPNMVFDAGPGDLFVVRNIAALVPPYVPRDVPTSMGAALEYAVRVLEVANVVVLGHVGCGGIGALMAGDVEHAGEFVGPWMQVASAARNRVLAWRPADPRTACEQEAIKLSLGNLMTFPWIAERVAGGKLALHGMSFDIATGALWMLDSDGVFRTVS